jgi:hypothetical protein
MNERGQPEGYDHDEAALYEQVVGDAGTDDAPGGEDQPAGEAAGDASGEGESEGDDDEDAPNYAGDDDAPPTSDGQIRPEGVAPGDGMGRGYSSLGPGPEGELHAQGHEGGRAHTPAAEGHPALDPSSSRSARDLGGPSIAPEDLDEAPDTTGGAKGDIQTKGMEPHE